LAFNVLHGVTSQKIVPFITTAARTSNPTKTPTDENQNCVNKGIGRKN
jgi:hypothetical protein